MLRWTSFALLALTACGDAVLEGPLKTCILEVTWTAGTSCVICAEAVLDGEVVNTENFVVYKSDKKFGYTEYDDWAAESCSTFWPATDLAAGSMQKVASCAELGYDQTDVFTFADGYSASYAHDGSCDTFEE